MTIPIENQRQHVSPDQATYTGLSHAFEQDAVGGNSVTGKAYNSGADNGRYGGPDHRVCFFHAHQYAGNLTENQDG